MSPIRALPVLLVIAMLSLTGCGDLIRGRSYDSNYWGSVTQQTTQTLDSKPAK